MATPDELRRALRQAEFRNLPLDDLPFTDDRTASVPEGRFLALCRRHRLAAPEVNVPVGPYRQVTEDPRTVAATIRAIRSRRLGR